MSVSGGAITTEAEFKERCRQNAASKEGRFEEPPELTAEDEAILDKVWAAAAARRSSSLSIFDVKTASLEDIAKAFGVSPIVAREMQQMERGEYDGDVQAMYPDGTPIPDDTADRTDAVPGALHTSFQVHKCRYSSHNGGRTSARCGT